MKVLNLCCAHDHGFEGWFASEEVFQSQIERTLVECPVCGDTTIHRLPTAPHLNMAKSREVAPVSSSAKAAPSPEAMTMQAMWLQAVKHVMANTDDVGERFAEEARRIHYGETEERAIRGQATREDAEALKEEGIDIVSLPVPAAAKGTIQ
jgi:hypothetical protein